MDMYLHMYCWPCNHVGCLFCIEAAILFGYTHQTCTSQLSQWNIPSQKNQIIVYLFGCLLAGFREQNSILGGSFF